MNTDTARITQDERFTLFLLSYVDTIGSETIKRVFTRLDSLSDILTLNENALKYELEMKDSQIIGLSIVKKQMSSIVKEYEILQNSPIKFTTFLDEDYPRRLLHVSKSPVILYSYGKLPRDDEPSIGIVGSRACTSYGAGIAEYYAEDLADNGVNVISGMAVGIDAAAHTGALRSIKGKTYAVLAGGVNVIYPRQNKDIYDAIISGERGAVISEMLPGKSAISKNFPMRNRIISGLSDIVLIVEAREKSGSLITVDYAKTQGIPIMAVPGRVTDPMSSGTNRLISLGYEPALSPHDILKKLNLSLSRSSSKNTEKKNLLDNDEKIVYSTLDSDPKHIDIILQDSGLERERVLEALISLEIKGLISQVSSNYYNCN